MPANQAAQLQCVFRPAHYLKAQVIYSEGGPAHQVFSLRSGLLKLIKSLENGKERIVRIVFPGETFGLEALTDSSYALSAVTLDDGEICAATPEELADCLRRNPEIALGMVRVLVGEVSRARREVAEMSFKDARRKVATFLLSLAPRANGAHARAASFRLPFSRQEISEILGLSPETISRIFGLLRKERFIEASGRRLTIRDRAGLEKAGQR
ncbi:MAG: Crp/Fnr family transcriptional regulator [Acidobacteriia bacterium]|nr:Crp/Fnr family transcriptional regulator [Terriglobia bacterium]